MADIRIKRRLTGAATAPTSLKNAELAFNEVNNTLYYGKGDDGTGSATSIIPIGGAGASTATADKLSTARQISLTGDVTGSVSFDGSADASITATIPDNSIANADLAQVATGIIKGRASEGSGNVEDLTAAQVRTLLNVADGATNLALASTDPSALGTASVGTGTTAARADHVHAMPSATDVGAIAATEKGAANGVATLGADGKVPAAQLPSYVDDVLEYADLAAFPASGETGKIYVDLDTNKTYRWGGSVYIEISASPGSTDAVAEGTTNLYFTDARAQTAVVVNSLSVSSSTQAPSVDAVIAALAVIDGGTF